MVAEIRRIGLEDLCVHQVCLAGQCDFAESLDVLKSHGIQRTALWSPMIESYGETAARIIWEASGLIADSLCVVELLAGENNLQMMLERAEKFGVRTLVMITGGFIFDVAGGIDAARELVLSRLIKADELARPFNVQLAFEPLHPMVCGNRSIVSSLAEALHIIEQLGDQHQIGLVIDCYALWWEHNLEEKISRAGKLISNYHVSDWLSDTRDLRLDRGMPGQGQIDLIKWRLMVEQAGFYGPVEIEIFSKERWWRTDPDLMLRSIIEGMNRFY